MNKLKDLCCLMCNKEPIHEDVFICKTNEDNHIEASLCLRCAEQTQDERVEKKGGWIIVKRMFNEFYAQDVAGEFKNLLTYTHI